MKRRILFDTKDNQVALAVNLTPEQTALLARLCMEKIISERYILIYADDEDFEEV